MLPRPPQPSRASLTRLLDAAQRRHHPQSVSPHQLHRYLAEWFPRQLWASVYTAVDADGRSSSDAQRKAAFHRFHREPVEVSRGWSAALELVALSHYVKGSPRNGQAEHARGGSETATTHALEHLLRFGVFPPAGWALTLALLHAWRQEQLRGGGDDGADGPDRHRPPPTTTSAAPHSSPPLFPDRLEPPAAAQLLYHTSLAPPSSAAWQDALWLYQLCAAQSYAPRGERVGTAEGQGRRHGETLPVIPASSAFLKALRHVCLTTLLRAGEWDRGLHFYLHSLYQRDSPGTVTTGHLVQELGRAGRWDAVLQVYALCVQLLREQRRRRRAAEPSSLVERPSREWGTTLSMAMAAVQGCAAAPPTTLSAMLQQLQGPPPCDAEPRAAAPPLVQLDGNFLRAVQALPSEEERVALLRLAKEEGMLDTFKLLRGLASRRQWEEALLLFSEAMRPTTPPSPAATKGAESTARGDGAAPSARRDEAWRSAHLSRREIGESRLHLLHASPLHTVATVVRVLNDHRSPQRADGGESRRSAAAAMERRALALNDREVECVLSKALEADEATVAESRAAADFWLFGLEVLARNYGSGGEDCVAGAVSSTSSAHRRPSTAALSFILRHPRLPWRQALHLVEQYRLLDDTAGPPALRSPHHHRGSGDAVVLNRSLAPRGLALSAAVERVSSQGQRRRAEKLALLALAGELAARQISGGAVSLSAALLRVVSYATLQRLLLGRRHADVYVESRVLFHILRTSTELELRRRHAEGGEQTPLTVVCARGDGEAFAEKPCGRALVLVHCLQLRHEGGAGALPVSEATRSSALSELPASLFAGDAGGSRSLRLVNKAPVDPPAAWWLLAYPPSVHCEVLRAIRCITEPVLRRPAPGNAAPNGDAAVCVSLRWTWSLRYLHSLAAFFACTTRSGAGTESGQQRHSTQDRARENQKAEAAQAYFVCTYEAVLGLLDCASFSSAAASSGVEEGAKEVVLSWGEVEMQGEEGMVNDSSGAPRTSRQRVQTLCQLLERAIVRYGCVPPTHMLLPNQLNRLLPPLSDGGAAPHTTPQSIAEKLMDAAAPRTSAEVQERCAVAVYFVKLVLDSLGPHSGGAAEHDAATRARGAVEPALLTNLIKLCCRVAEHQRRLVLSGRGEGVTPTSAEDLCKTGLRALRLQCERCGAHTVRPSAVSLLYHLCAAAQDFCAAESSSTPKMVALEATAYLLNAQAAPLTRRATPQRQRSSPPSTTTATAASGADERCGCADGAAHRRRHDAVQPHHCRLFFSMFGWEDALRVWYPAFPREVLSEVSANASAVEFCLGLSEHETT